MKQTALAPSNANTLQKSNIGLSESDWADLSTEIMAQIVTLLSDQLMSSSTVWPKDTRIPAVQLVCRHWHDAASECTIFSFKTVWPALYSEHLLTCRTLHIKHIPLAQGNDFELGLLLAKFTAAQSLRVRFQALTGKSLAALRNYTNLRRLDLIVDDLNDHYDKLLVKAVFTLTHLEKLKLDVGPLGDSNLSAFAWAALAKLQQLELRVCFKAPHSCYDCLLALPELDDLCLHHGSPTVQTLQALTRITRLQMFMSSSTAADSGFLSALQSLTGLQSLQLDGQPAQVAVESLTALTGLTALDYWPDPYRFACVVSTCPIHALSGFCCLSNLQKLQIAVVDDDTVISAHLMIDNVDTYQPSVDVFDLHESISFSVWSMTIWMRNQ